MTQQAEQHDSPQNEQGPVEQLRTKACDRRPLLWILTLLALTTETLAIVSYYWPSGRLNPDEDGVRWAVLIEDAWIGVGQVAPSAGGPDEFSHFEIPLVLQYTRYTNLTPTLSALLSTPKYDGWGLMIHMWPLVALFGVYPAYAVTLEVVRHIRRYRRGLCENCGYNLQGNDLGRCPECGNRFDPQAISRKIANRR